MSIGEQSKPLSMCDTDGPQDHVNCTARGTCADPNSVCKLFESGDSGKKNNFCVCKEGYQRNHLNLSCVGTFIKILLLIEKLGFRNGAF